MTPETDYLKQKLQAETHLRQLSDTKLAMLALAKLLAPNNDPSTYFVVNELTDRANAKTEGY